MKSSGYLTFILSALGSIVNSQFVSIEDFVKIRCSVDGSDTFYFWEGSIYSFTPQEKQKKLLNFIGYNVGRCEEIDGTWKLITREISYYTDPKTNEKIDRWSNPYTGEEVTVAHVANDPVNGDMYPATYSVGSTQSNVINSDVNLLYTNPLHDNKTYWEYSGVYPLYEGGEYFKFYYEQEALDKAENSVDEVPISWTRLSQWLPWMKMGTTVGHVFYSCSGGRIKDISALPQWLQDDVNERMSLYLTAPATYDPEVPNQSSLTYFKENFDAYINGELFPISAMAE